VVAVVELILEVEHRVVLAVVEQVAMDQDLVAQLIQGVVVVEMHQVAQTVDLV
jgi:hypothetical protein